MAIAHHVLAFVKLVRVAVVDPMPIPCRNLNGVVKLLGVSTSLVVFRKITSPSET